MRQLVPYSIIFILLLGLVAGCGKKDEAGSGNVRDGAPSGGASGKITFKTSDGWTIHADFYPAPGAKKAVVLLHQRGGSAADWQPLIPKLASAGVSALAVDQRGAGRSRGPRNGEDAPWDTTQDISAAIKWLKGRGLGEDQISLAGASYGANNALIYAAARPSTPSVVLISPGTDYHGPKIEPAARSYSGGRILVVTDAGDSITNGGPQAILTAANRAEIKTYDGSDHGTALLSSHPDSVDLIVKFLTK